MRNMMEFVEMVIRNKAPEDQVAVHLGIRSKQFSPCAGYRDG